MAAFIFGLFVGFFLGWLVCALMVHAGREGDAMDIEARRVTIGHRPDCPVSDPNFRLPPLADGTVDTTAPSRCTCDFGPRLREVS